MNIEDLLDRPIAFHRPLVTLTGSIAAALMLSQAIYWSRRTKPKGGWFYKTQKEWEEETGLSRTEQDSARRRLRELGFWFEERRDVPAKLYFHINAQYLQSCLQETCNLDVAKPASKMEQNPQPLRLTETTTETTTQESSAAAPRSSIQTCENPEKQGPTLQQDRFGNIAKLANHAFRLAARGLVGADLAEELKSVAAREGIPYFDAWPGAASPIDQAMTIAEQRLRESA